MAAHRAWYARGKTGDGRLILNGRNLGGIAVASLRGARLEHCDLSNANMSIGLMDAVELIDCVFDDARMNHSSWDQAELVNCRFLKAWLGLAKFEHARISGCDWTAAYLETSMWSNSDVNATRFVDANLVDSRFDGALFSQVDFRGAKLCRIDEAADFARCPNTRFIDCDFRGANLTGLRLNDTTFERCRFHGVIGAPVLEGPVTIIDADFSEAGDGSDLRSQAVVMAMWEP